jgi:hypothetical protein
VGNKTDIMKLVLCPVVERTPALIEVLYRGQLYRRSFSSNFTVGTSRITGSGGYMSPRIYNTHIVNLVLRFKIKYDYYQE